MHVDRALLDDHLVAPDLVHQLGARVDPVRVRHEVMQQAELGRAERERLPLPFTRCAPDRSAVRDFDRRCP
jgi:hypothetical protein